MSLPVAHCRRAGGGVAVDAKLDSAMWAAAEVLTLGDFRGSPLRHQTTVRALWDERALHVMFACAAVGDGATMTARDQPLWEEGNVVELFIDVAGTGERYYEFQLNPLGTLLDLFFERIGQPWREAARWNAAGIETAVHVDRAKPLGEWRAQLAIPFAALGGRVPRAGEGWRVNFYRYTTVASAAGDFAEYGAWSPTIELNFHQPAHFGTMIFEDAPAR